MRVRWLGRSAFTLSAGSTSVVIDPFDDAAEVLAARALRFAYPDHADAPVIDVLVRHDHQVRGQAALDGDSIGGDRAAALARQLGARWTVPMHHRTGWVVFLEPVDAFLNAFAQDERLLLDGASFESDELPGRDTPLAVVPTL